MAGGAIKGITVEIGGNTTKLGKALGEGEKKSRSLQVELRQVEKLLKFDPTNTELLVQKQDILADMIAETSKQLEIMREAEAQVVAQFEKGEIGEDQLRAFQREIIKTEQSLNDMQAELKTANRNLEEFGDNNGVAKAETAKLEKQIQEQNDALEAEKKALKDAEKAQKDHEQAVAKAKETVSDFKEKVSDMAATVGKGATVIAGATVTAGGYALNLSTQFDKAYNNLATKTGASAAEMEELNASMEAVYANNFGDSIEDVANSMATVKQNTKLSGDELQTATERALLMRDTFEFDVNESTRTAKMLMDQYGMSADDAYNLIAQGAQNGLNKNGDLLDTINEYGVHFAGLGLSSEDMFNMLVNGAENGTFSVDKLGDSVKEFGIRVKDGTADNAFKELGFDVDQTKQKFAKGGEGAKKALGDVTKALFEMEDPVKQNQLGVELFGTMWEDLGADGVKSLMNLDGKISTTSDALDKINEQKYDDIGSALQGLGRTLETEVALPIGEELKPVVEDAISFVKENAPQIKEVISGIVDAVRGFISFVVEHGDIIISIIAGIGAGLLVWNVVSMITGVVNAIKAFKTANEAATIAQAIFNAVMNANPIAILVTVIAAVVTAIVTFIATNEDARKKFVEIWNAIKKFASTVWNGIKKVAETVWNAIKGFLTGVWNGIKNVASGVWNGIKNVVTGVINGIKNVITTIFNFIKNFFTGNMSAVKNTIGNGWNAIKNVVTGVLNGIKNVVSSVWNGIKSVVGSVVNGIRNTVSSVWNGIKSTTSSAFNGIKSSMTNALNSAKSSVTNVCKNIFNGMKNIFSGVSGVFKGIGSNVIGGIKSGISGAVSGLYNTIKNSLSGLVRKAKNALGIHSPSRVFADVIGKQIPAGIAVGIDDNTDVADEAVQNMTDELTDQTLKFNGATINRKLSTTFKADPANNPESNDSKLLSKLDSIYERLTRLQIVLDTGALVGETIDRIDAGLADKQLLSARGV